MKPKKRGYVLVEVILSLTILGFILPLLVLSVGSLLHSQNTSKDYNQALVLAQDGLEISYNLFQTDFASFPVGPGIYHSIIDVDQWALVLDEGEPFPGFTRRIEIKPLYRKPDGDLTDDNTFLEESAVRRIEVTVFWQEDTQNIVLKADFINWENVVL